MRTDRRKRGRPRKNTGGLQCAIGQSSFALVFVERYHADRHHREVPMGCRLNYCLLWALLAMFGACNDEPEAPDAQKADALVDTVDVTTSDEITVQDSNSDDDTTYKVEVNSTDVPDVAPVDAGPSCPGAPGCPCKQPVDCKVPFCIEAPEGWMCARLCGDGCTDAETCLKTTGPEGGPAEVCVPRWPRLCNPCAYNAECGGVAVKGAVCVDRADQGAYCGVLCATDADCPPEFICKNVTDIDGKPAQQCVHGTKACVCSKLAIEEGLSTPCTSSAADGGDCLGKRHCATAGTQGAPAGGGLTACLVAPGSKESCNGQDDDCDGKTDEGACDDGNLCASSLCQATTATSSGWTCVVNKKTDCDDDQPCTQDSCKPESGCQHEPMADGAGCGNQDVCKNQVCKAKNMVEVPAGKFWMGCNPAVEGAAGCAYMMELPQHEVWLSAFLMDIYEVTVEGYAKCVNAGACTAPKKDFGYEPFFSWLNPGKEKYPIVGVDWFQADAYCKWVHPKGRLPTEAEWEKAARGGCEKNKGKDCAKAMRTYPWGNQPPDCTRSVILVPPATGCVPENCGQGCKTLFTFPVGSKPKGVSPYGVYDMSGNASEWVADCYAADAYEVNKAKGGKDPTWNVCDKKVNRVLRGGSYNSLHKELRSSDRHDHVNESVDNYVGFRCARAL